MFRERRAHDRTGAGPAVAVPNTNGFLLRIQPGCELWRCPALKLGVVAHAPMYGV